MSIRKPFSGKANNEELENNKNASISKDSRHPSRTHDNNKSSSLISEKNSTFESPIQPFRRSRIDSRTFIREMVQSAATGEKTAAAVAAAVVSTLGSQQISGVNATKQVMIFLKIYFYRVF